MNEVLSCLPIVVLVLLFFAPPVLAHVANRLAAGLEKRGMEKALEASGTHLYRKDPQ